MKTCITCGQNKILQEFYMNTSRGKSYYYNSCKKCLFRKKNDQQRAKAKLDGVSLTKYRDQHYVNSYLYNSLRGAKGRAEGTNGNWTRKTEFNLTLKDVRDVYDKQGGKCVITGVVMEMKKDKFFALTIDRIDSTKGYIKSNIQLVCFWANIAKNTLSKEELVVWCQRTVTLAKKGLK